MKGSSRSLAVQPDPAIAVEPTKTSGSAASVLPCRVVSTTVADLDVVTAFSVALGLEVEDWTFVEGEFLDTVCGIPDSGTEIVMLKPPDDGTRLELSSFVRPVSLAERIG